MSEGERQTALRFSLGGVAVQVACGLILIAGCAWIIYAFGFHLDDVSENSARRQWLLDFLRSNGGATGAIAGALMLLPCCWWTWRAFRRFATAARAAVLAEQALILHPLYGRETQIPLADIASATVDREQLFIHSLYVRLSNGRLIKLRHNSIEGGKEALEAFAAELNAQRNLAAGTNQA